MATTTEISRVRRMTNASLEDYPDADINETIDDNSGDLNLAAAQIWEEKAAKYSELVDTTESGSSRKQSRLYDNAREQAAYYRQKADDAVVTADERPRTRRIVRV